MNFPFAFPPMNGKIPNWEGNRFRIGSELTKVLKYSLNNLEWNDELTLFHEESAGNHYFIDRASRDHAIQELKKYINEKNKPVILEIGCSSGFMLQCLHKNFPQAILMGSDVASEPLQKLSESLSDIPLLQFDLINCPLPDNSIDAIVMLNVLEHIENAYAAIKQIYRILKSGGVVIHFFRDNLESYNNGIQNLDTFITIRSYINNAIPSIAYLLDIGNGGVFDYDVELIPQIVGLDLFLDKLPPSFKRPPNVTMKAGSDLDIPFKMKLMMVS